MPPVIVFDGYCNLCNGWVDFVITRDRKRRFRFATLQGETGERLVHEADPRLGNGESVVLLDDGRAYSRSTAALRILGKLGFPWALLSALLVIPRPVRDAVYQFVARNRYRWFGRRNTCRLPTHDEKHFFLDM